MPGRGARFGKGRLGRIHAIGDRDQVALGDGDALAEGARPAHADQIARRAKIAASLAAISAGAAGDQGVEYNFLTGLAAFQHRSAGFMAQNERRHPTGIVAVPGMHVRTADAHGIDLDQGITSPRLRVGFVAISGLLGPGIDQCLHLSLTTLR